MSQETQEFSVKEVLQFIHDSLRFMRASGTLPRDWTTKDSASMRNVKQLTREPTT
jgi:hypothetical protein